MDVPGPFFAFQVFSLSGYHLISRSTRWLCLLVTKIAIRFSQMFSVHGTWR